MQSGRDQKYCLLKVLHMKRILSNSKMVPISSEQFSAVIFDLDGVVTRTAKVHAAAWKRMFDEYLHQRSVNLGEKFRPFKLDSDYRLYVDGKPRTAGAKCFLESRNISLPFGKPDDPPGKETVCGLGKKKDLYFLDLLKEEGVEVYKSSIRLIRNLRTRKIHTAVVSSSRNCRQVLEAAGILDLFDEIIDGKDSASLGLKGKPDPDAFLEAAGRIGVEPKHAVVFEDAMAGVEAGRRGGFGFVVGVDRTGKPETLFSSGAHAVVSDLAQIVILNGIVSSRAAHLPSALSNIEDIKSIIRNRRLAVFLDYDGTLTPIVNRPEDAVLSEKMYQAIQLLAKRCTVAVISGRDLQDVISRVGVQGIIYAGSHGFEITGPQASSRGFQQSMEYLPILDRVEERLRSSLERFPGVLIERKKFSVAVHFRMAEHGDLKSIKEIAEQAAASHQELRRFYGKMVIEIQPAIPWDKGKAVVRLLGQISTSPSEMIPLYIGDDTTDEDAFVAIQRSGIGIFVGTESRTTAARYTLKNPDEVRKFLETVALSVLPEVTR